MTREEKNKAISIIQEVLRDSVITPEQEKWMGDHSEIMQYVASAGKTSKVKHHAGEKHDLKYYKDMVLIDRVSEKCQELDKRKASEMVEKLANLTVTRDDTNWIDSHKELFNTAQKEYNARGQKRIIAEPVRYDPDAKANEEHMNTMLIDLKAKYYMAYDTLNTFMKSPDAVPTEGEKQTCTAQILQYFAVENTAQQYGAKAPVFALTKDNPNNFNALENAAINSSVVKELSKESPFKILYQTTQMTGSVNRFTNELTGAVNKMAKQIPGNTAETKKVEGRANVL